MDQENKVTETGRSAGNTRGRAIENMEGQEAGQLLGKPEVQLEKGSVDRKRKRTAIILVAGAAICALISGWLLFDYHRTGIETDRVLEALRLEGQVISQDELEVDRAVAGVVGTPAVPAFSAMESPYAEAFREYPDIKGWLQVEGTPVDYPILQREGEDEYYLYLDFRGNEDRRGSLILDEDSSVEEGEFTTNLLVHGHNMKDGSMFGSLDEYRSEDYYREHTHMTLYTRDGVHEYEVTAVFESQVFYVTDQVFKYYNFFQADTAEEFHYFYDNIKELSLYDTGVTAEYGDRFLTLSTCAYHVEDGRFVVVAKEIVDGI